MFINYSVVLSGSNESGREGGLGWHGAFAGYNHGNIKKARRYEWPTHQLRTSTEWKMFMSQSVSPALFFRTYLPSSFNACACFYFPSVYLP